MKIVTGKSEAFEVSLAMLKESSEAFVDSGLSPKRSMRLKGGGDDFFYFKLTVTNC